MFKVHVGGGGRPVIDFHHSCEESEDFSGERRLLTRQLLRHEHAAVLSSPMSFPNTRDKERIPCACCYAHGERVGIIVGEDG